MPPKAPKKVAKCQKMKKKSKLNMFPHSGTGFGFKITQKLRNVCHLHP